MVGDSTRERPTLVFIHGAFHQSWIWDAVLDRLKPGGRNAQTIDLPSVAVESRPRMGMHDDAKAIRDLLGRTNGPKTLVAHSYGGIPVTQVAHKLPGVHHIIYIAAFQLADGESLLGAVGGRIPSWWNVNDNVGTVDRPIEVFYHDVEPKIAIRALDRLLPSTFAAFTEPVTDAAWRYIASTYIICENDQSGPPHWQEPMAQRAERVHRIPTGHFPMLSQPDALAEIINDVGVQ